MSQRLDVPSDSGITIGWYVHHQGEGHLSRFLSIANRMAKLAPIVRLVGLGSRAPRDYSGEWVLLPRDDEIQSIDADPTGGGALHWAPLRRIGMRQRSVITAEWISQVNCQLFVADVSVEMLTLARLCSTPTVAMAMRGKRDDRVHSLGYDLSSALLAPWPAQTQEHMPAKWHKKLIAVGSFSRFDHLIFENGTLDQAPRSPTILLVLGSGGHQISIDEIRSAAAATPDWQWRIAGLVTEAESSTTNCQFLGFVRDMWSELKQATVVAGPCGTGLVSEVAAARKPFIALPQPRPFDEQVAQGKILSRSFLATVANHWPSPDEWPALLDQAQRSSGRKWEWYNDGQGASRACRALLGLARAERVQI